MRFLTRRFGFYLVALFASITINFLIPRAMPGDPASAVVARYQGRLPPEQIDSIKAAMGISDGPLIIQYLEYLKSIATGDLGVSLSQFPSPVSDVLATSMRWTVLLGLTTVILSFLLGSFIGMLAAWRRGGKIDTFVPPSMVLMGSFPYFFLGQVALYFLAMKAELLPMRHAHSTELSPALSLEFFGSVAKHLILPAGTVIFVSLGGWMLGMRNTMISVLSEDYVTFAEAKGLSQRRIMMRYAMRNALLPNITGFGMALGFILSGQIVVEFIFSYPGFGYWLARGVGAQDYPLIQAIFLMITVAVLFANMLVDILYVRLDPRVRVR